MRILHVISTLDPSAGGPPMVVSRLAAAQARCGHDVSVLSYESKSSALDVDGLFDQIPGGASVARRSLPPPTGFDKVLARDMRTLCGEMVPKAEFMHVHGVWEPFLLVATSTARTHSVPYAIAPHGMLNPWSLNQRSLKKNIALALGWRKMLNGASFYHVLNEDEERPTRRLGLRAPTRVIPNGIFLEELESNETTAAVVAPHEKPYILFLSRLHPGKGADLLIDAFAAVSSEFPDMHLVIAGPDAGARSECERRIASHDLNSCVSMPGAVWGDDKIALMKNAACFCLPSQHEGFSVAITEAMAFGLPVVISTECHFPEVAEVGAGEIVPLNVDAIAEGLRRVLRDDDQRRTMGDAGRELILSKYTWPKIAQRTIEIYGKYAS